MPSRVREIMNPELFSVRAGDATSDVLNGILALGVSGAPVLDDQGRPLGVVSLRDLVERNGARASDVMTSPALTIEDDARIVEGGHRLAETGRHRLVVVDAEGRAIGVVSALDVIRGKLAALDPRDERVAFRRPQALVRHRVQDLLFLPVVLSEHLMQLLA